MMKIEVGFAYIHIGLDGFFYFCFLQVVSHLCHHHFCHTQRRIKNDPPQFCDILQVKMMKIEVGFAYIYTCLVCTYDAAVEDDSLYSPAPRMS